MRKRLLLSFGILSADRVPEGAATKGLATLQTVAKRVRRMRRIRFETS